MVPLLPVPLLPIIDLQNLQMVRPLLKSLKRSQLSYCSFCAVSQSSQPLLTYVGLSCPAKGFIGLVIVKQIADIPAEYCYYIVIIIIIIIIYYYQLLLGVHQHKEFGYFPLGRWECRGCPYLSLPSKQPKSALTFFAYFFD